MNYRKDIDGLRAIAVLSILIYHLGINILPGGFVGVDIFFVISGYLISKNLYHEIETNTFSIANFYNRRARRILPGLISVLVASSAAAYLLLYPNELLAYAKSAVAALLFSANIYFFSALDYFSPKASEIPLLHLWSLGIEEQFYILLPLLVIGTRKLSQKNTTLTLALLAAISLIFSQSLLSSDTQKAFYLLPFRAFELLIGSLIARPSIENKNPSQIISIVGRIVGWLALILPILFYSDRTLFPGVAAAVPCFGTALLIWLHKTPNNQPKILALPAITFIGKISYSLYLVHWPLVVFAQRALPKTSPIEMAFYVFSTSIFLAWVNYRFIEQPFRFARKAWKPGRVLLTSGVAIIACLIPVCFTVVEDGFPGDPSDRVAKALQVRAYNPTNDYRAGVCFLDPDQDSEKMDLNLCLPSTEKKSAVLWGDSHAAHLYTGLKKTLAEHDMDLGQLTMSACPPILDFEIPGRPFCIAANKKFLSLAQKINPDLIILSASWLADPARMAAQEKTFNYISQLGFKHIIVLGPAPTFKRYVPLIIADQIKNITPNSINELDESNIFKAESEISNMVSKHKNMKYVSILKTVCHKNVCPLTGPDGAPLIYDISHLMPEGSHYYSKLLTPLIIKQLQNPAGL